MASYIINDNGNSGPSRADFVSALEGLQPLLESGRNIKTLNGTSVLGSGNIEVNGSPQEYTYDLTDYEKGLKNDVLSKLSALNPNGNFFTFGVISDLHTVPTKSEINTQYQTGELEDICQELIDAGIELRGEGITDAASAASYIKDNWPTTVDNYNGLTCEPNVILLGAIGYEYGLDGVFCAGDLGAGSLPYDCNSYAMWRIKDLLKQYISVPLFVTEGNHDRWYGNNRTDLDGCRGCTEWLKWLNVLNTKNRAVSPATDTVKYIGSDGEFLPSNTYYIDFPARKVRVIMRSQYEKQEWVNSQYHPTAQSNNLGAGNFFKYLNSCLSFTNPADAADWSVMVVSHNINNESSNRTNEYLNCYFGGYSHGVGAGSDGFTLPAPNGNNAGKCVIGEIDGHIHPVTRATRITNGKLETITLLNSGQFTKSALATQRNGSNYYCFSIFVFDDVNFNLHEIKVGYQYNTGEEYYGAQVAGVFTFPLRHH